jgi:hypothetical protein
MLKVEVAELFVEHVGVQTLSGVCANKQVLQYKKQKSTQLGEPQFRSNLLVQGEANKEGRDPK